MKLVVVESPAKAKTINKYLDKTFAVIASFGHVRGLPSKSGSVIPEDNFKMKYEVLAKSSKHLDEIVKKAKGAEMIYLATDQDREGESIAWHIAEILKEKKAVTSDNILKRITFNEITKKAILESIKNPKLINAQLVKAQQARQALDYLFGFTVSPILWRKLKCCKSAGRVQSVALRLICEREEEIERFQKREYWDIKTELKLQNKPNDKTKIIGRLTHIEDKKLGKFDIGNEKQAKDIVTNLSKIENVYVDKVTKSKKTYKPPRPFITSSLQQEAYKKFGFGVKKTMQIAQKMYEGVEIKGSFTGLITYMRTDCVTISDEAISDIRNIIEKKFGNDYLPKSKVVHTSKVKNAQEAHEAIRPTNIFLDPDSLEGIIDADQLKLYRVIWTRTIASQMASAIISSITATFKDVDKIYTIQSSGSCVEFSGFYKIYRESTEDKKEKSDSSESNNLPQLDENELASIKKVIPGQHFTAPPARYSEASLVETLEKLGIGRPSTYASIIEVLKNRQYAIIESKRFLPTESGRVLNVFLMKLFCDYVEYTFTSSLEDELDNVSNGIIEGDTVLKSFWEKLQQKVLKTSSIQTIEIVNIINEELEQHIFGNKKDEDYKRKKMCPKCNGQMTLKVGKHGPFLGCSNHPNCVFCKNFNGSEMTNEPTDDKEENSEKELCVDNDGRQVFLKHGPYGAYLEVSSLDEQKPKRVSIPNTVNIENLTRDDILRLVSLPITVGEHPGTKQTIYASIGKYGPYLKYNNKFYAIHKKQDPFLIKLDDAIAIIRAKDEKDLLT